MRLKRTLDAGVPAERPLEKSSNFSRHAGIEREPRLGKPDEGTLNPGPDRNCRAVGEGWSGLSRNAQWVSKFSIRVFGAGVPLPAATHNILNPGAGNGFLEIHSRDGGRGNGVGEVPILI